MTARTWVFTLNNYDSGDVQLFKDLDVRRIVFGEEVGESGTPHLQGYVTFKRSYRLSALKKISKGAHWEVAKCEDFNYCLKDKKYFVKDNRSQGARSDLVEIKELAGQGRYGDIAEKYTGLWLRYERGIRQLHEAKNIDIGVRDWVTEVHVFWGESGTGKSRGARKLWAEIGGDSLCNMRRDNNFWSKYNGEDDVIWDDFDGSWIKRADFLDLTDRYETKVRQIGGWANWKPRRIYITSNTHPEAWYKHMPEAVMRRCVTVTEVT